MGFGQAVARLLHHEGGFQQDPNDPGNWTGGRVGAGENRGTKFGISAASYPDLDIASLTNDEAIGIYRKDWWERYGYERLPAPIAEAVFLFSVNAGPGRAHRVLQEALVDLGVELRVDGVLGPLTCRETTSYRHQDVLLAVINAGAIAYYRSLRQPHYLAGWVRRVIT